MKTNKTLLVFTALMLFFFTTKSFSQVPEVHYITLYVDTSNINSQNENAVSNFGQEEGISNAEYTIYARKGDVIIWKGLSSSAPDDVVNIVSINYEGGTNIFNQNILLGDNGSPEKVSGTVVNGNLGDFIKYKISFTVLNNGTRRQGTYHIDPKIQIN